MQEEIKQALKLILGPKRIVIVLHRESWIIAEEEGKQPRLERSRYFTFIDDELGETYPVEQTDVACMTREAEKAVQEFIRDELGLKRFEPGKNDPPSLLEAWA